MHFLRGGTPQLSSRASFRPTRIPDDPRELQRTDVVCHLPTHTLQQATSNLANLSKGGAAFLGPPQRTRLSQTVQGRIGLRDWARAQKQGARNLGRIEHHVRRLPNALPCASASLGGVCGGKKFSERLGRH